MKAAVSVLFGLALLAAGPLRAEGLLLRGTVGKYPIVMELDEADGNAWGAYFYQKHKQDIPLQGERGPEGFRLSSAVHDSDNADHFVLARNGDGFKGTFTHGKGTPLAVDLHAVAPDTVPDPRPGLEFRQPLPGYERLRLAGIERVSEKKETVGGKYQIQWYTEPRSRVTMFHVVGGYPEPVMVKFNRVIDRDYYDHLSHYFSCSDGTGGSGIDAMEISSHYLTDRFVSYSVSSSWTCYGAAHPDFETRGTTIDARTGSELTLEDVYWLGSGKKPVADTDAWYQYRREVFAPAVVMLFQRLYPEQMKAGGEDDCDYADPSVWGFANWYLTAKGLYVGAQFARVARACDNPGWSFIPFEVLKQNNSALFGE